MGKRNDRTRPTHPIRPMPAVHDWHSASIVLRHGAGLLRRFYGGRVEEMNKAVIHKSSVHVRPTYSDDGRMYFAGVHRTYCGRLKSRAEKSWKNTTCKQCLRKKP